MQAMSRIQRPPGPSSLSAFRAVVATRTTDADFFTRAARRHPRIAYVRLGSEHLYLLFHPDLVRALLVDAGRITTKSRGLAAARRILGNGLLTSEDPFHRQQRRIVQPAFHASRIAAYERVMADAVERTTAGWRDGDRVDMAAEMSTLTFDVVARALFGSDLRGSAGEVRTALAELLSAYNRSFLPWFDLLLRLRTPVGRRVEAARARLDAVVARVVAEAHGGESLSALLSAHMPAEQVRDETMTLLLAGHETTSSTLTFAWYLLARHPDIAAWMRGDAARTRAVVAETLRLYPPAWVLGRRLTEPLSLDGWTLPAGSTGLVSQRVLHRDPRFWPDPLRFRPQRWLTVAGEFDLEAPGQPRAAYFPFGAGSRICVGESFAWAEAVLVLSSVAGWWAPQLPPGFALRLRPAITLRPYGPVPMTLRHPAG